MLIKKSDTEISHFREELTHAMGAIREEFNEHLLAINENTNEIQSNYEFLCELDGKIERLTERIDRIQYLLEGKRAEERHTISPLNGQEQAIVDALQGASATLTYEELSSRSGQPLPVVRSYISHLIAKGVPVMKKYAHNEVFLFLDPAFKQARGAGSSRATLTS